MKIRSLHVENIGLFNKLDIEFNSGFNFISGPNASGKTSILRNISLALSHVSINQFRYRDGAEVWIEFNDNLDTVKRLGFGKDWMSNPDQYQGASLKSWNAPEKREGIESLSPHGLENNGISFAPLFISAFRKISYVKIQGMTQENTMVEQIKKYRNQSSTRLNGTDMPNVKQWLINRYFQIEKEWAINEKQNWIWLLENIEQLGPSDSNFNFIEIRRDLEPIFSIKGNQCYLEELSAGYQAILSIIFCIFDWVEGTNKGDEMLVKNAKGSVLIDELDAHLHPEWQLTIRDSFERIFPNLQFIITTHSPHLIATAKQNELLIIPEHNGELKLQPSLKTYSGWNTDQILEDLMGVRSLTNKTYSELIEKSLDFVEKNDIEALKASIDDLKKVSHSDDTIVSSFEIKLATLKLKKQ